MGGILCGAVGRGAPGVPTSAGIALDDILNLTANMTWQSDGDLILTTAGGGASTSSWVTPKFAGIGAYYQVKIDVTSGAFDGGSSPTGSYQDLGGSDLSWTESSGTVGFTYTIREKATGIVRSTVAGNTLTA